MQDTPTEGRWRADAARQHRTPGPAQDAEAAADHLQRQIGRRTKCFFAAGVLLWSGIELVRLYLFPAVRPWTVVGWSFPVLLLATLAVIVSHASLVSALGSPPRISKPIRREELVRAFAAHDTECIRVVRGLAACMYVVALTYGTIFSMIVAMYTYP